MSKKIAKIFPYKLSDVRLWHRTFYFTIDFIDAFHLELVRTFRSLNTDSLKTFTFRFRDRVYVQPEFVFSFLDRFYNVFVNSHVTNMRFEFDYYCLRFSRLSDSKVQIDVIIPDSVMKLMPW